MFLMSLVALIVQPSITPHGAWIGLIVPPFMVAFFAALLKFAKYLARGERDFLLRFLHDTTGAMSANA
jgi:hypothetical protein